MKHCCKNVVILMPEPVAEPALNGLRLNLRIVSIVMFNFASYLTIGLTLAVLPGYVHDVMGFSAFWAGLVISLQYFATFITLFYDAKGWDGAAFALTLFSCAFVGTRLLFPNGINRIGGLNVAMICFSVEIIGLLLVGVATMPWMAKIGVLLAGAGFSLVFPALGVVAVKAVPQQNQGAALATYTVFMDLSLGVTGPLAGLVMSWAGVPVIYLAAAGLVAIALLLTWRLKKRPPEHVPEAASSS
ncbi:MFS transporter [Escherichia coli]